MGARAWLANQGNDCSSSASSVAWPPGLAVQHEPLEQLYDERSPAHRALRSPLSSVAPSVVQASPSSRHFFQPVPAIQAQWTTCQQGKPTSNLTNPCWALTVWVKNAAPIVLSR